MKIEVIAQSRAKQGSGASRRLRHAGKVPGIVYGGNVAPLVIELDHNNLFHAMRNEAFHSSILDLVVDGKAEKVLLRATQWHAYKQQIQHVDFQRVAADQKLHMKVPLHFVNGEIAPGVKLGGGIVNHILTEVEVSCLPGDLPEFIEVDLSKLAAGAAVHLSELKLPKGVELVSLGRGEDLAVAAIAAVRGGGSAE
ncbi:50S ribosomal protein L25/general stress protein Ctc [Leeia aquatica]|uniref:Large ribosomal subunit protein bL25 n=1 Tax=Leeia aquatica TaxID=2725557 RepID=A0A847RVL8_9NEIS|nr:50S ribosomal protein L25/general stress protein Ctc [Leeia aquatica]NLR75230.1 50S ribosomal protein L25/general stress protein Ctc [Leeia aquatica]